MTTGLIVAELALTLVLLAGAGFMARSFLHLYRLDVGFDTSRLVTMALIVPARKYSSFDDRISFLQRLDERLIGIRMALGAQQPQVWWLVLRRGIIQLTTGLILGLAGALGVGRLLQSMLVRTTPADLVTLVSISVVLIAVAIGACLWPAWQATRLDPVNARRYE